VSEFGNFESDRWRTCAWQLYAVIDFVWNYALPVGIFVRCYGRIFQAVRHHNKIVSAGQVSDPGGNQELPMATLPRDQNHGEDEQQQPTDNKFSRTELNVLQTVVTIIVCFVVCWAPTSLANFIQTLMVCARLLADRTNGRAIATLLRLSSVVVVVVVVSL